MGTLYSKKSGQMTLDEIKKVLIKRYFITHRGTGDRELVIWQPKKERATECYFFALAGTPPKGYGIYIPGKRSLCLYDADGKRFKEYYLQKGIEGISD